MNRVFGALIFAASVLSGPALAQSPTYEVIFNDTILNADPDGFTLGDRFILNDTLRDGTTDIGRIAGVCTLFDLNGFLLCSLTFELPDGTISAQFINSPPPEKTFAVLGGTGAYAGREGYGVLVERGDGTGTLVFHWEE